MWTSEGPATVWAPDEKGPATVWAPDEKVARSGVQG